MYSFISLQLNWFFGSYIQLARTRILTDSPLPPHFLAKNNSCSKFSWLILPLKSFLLQPCMSANFEVPPLSIWLTQIPLKPWLGQIETYLHTGFVCSFRGLGYTVSIINQGTSLVVQWLGLFPPNAGGLGSIPDPRTRSCTWKGSCIPQLGPKDPMQPNTYIHKFLKNM